jgi:molybdenum cofactor cytidylyltransferase
MHDATSLPTLPHAAAIRAVAMIPAAGKSRRMGAAKLLLPWGDGTVIEAVIAAWRNSGVGDVIAVVSAEDDRLAELCRTAGAHVVAPPVPPPEMKDSLQAAIAFAERLNDPGSLPDCFLVAPADMPWLESATIDRLLAAFAESPAEIIVPTHAGRRGHPIVVPWPLAAEVMTLADGESLKTLVERHPARTIECNVSILGDLDTPEDYQAVRQRWKK